MSDFTLALKGRSYIPCGELAFKWLSRVPLCDRHYGDARSAVAAHLQADETAWEQIAYGSRDWEADSAEVVYYIRRMSDGLIKIGTSSMYRRRVSELRREHGPVEVLLTHRGGTDTEDEMHRKFEDLWVRDEFFLPGKPLLAWVVKIRKRQIPGTELKGTIAMNDLLILSAALRSQSG